MMLSDSILVESRSARDEQLATVNPEKALEIVNKAKALVMATNQGTGIATTEQMADYYEVPADTVKKALSRHRDEFESDGLREIKGKELKALSNIGSDITSPTQNITRLNAWTPRAALRLGLVLRDSAIAKQIRTLILDMALNPQVSPPPQVALTSAQEQLQTLEMAYDLLEKMGGADERDRIAFKAQVKSIVLTENPDQFVPTAERRKERPASERYVKPDSGKSNEFIFADPVRFFADMCLAPSEEDRPEQCLDSKRLHSYYLAFCRAFKCHPMQLQLFVKQLKEILPGHHIARQRSQVDWRLHQLAHWKNLQVLPEAFEDSSQDSQPKCIKNLCRKGQLQLFGR